VLTPEIDSYRFTTTIKTFIRASLDSGILSICSGGSTGKRENHRRLNARKIISVTKRDPATIRALGFKNFSFMTSSLFAHRKVGITRRMQSSTLPTTPLRKWPSIVKKNVSPKYNKLSLPTLIRTYLPNSRLGMITGPYLVGAVNPLSPCTTKSTARLNFFSPIFPLWTLPPGACITSGSKATKAT